MRKLLAGAVAVLMAVAVAACGGGTAVIARCPSGVQQVAKRVGSFGNASLIVCKDGTVWKINP